MKRIFIAATLSIMAGGYAIAADLPQPPPPQAPAAYVPVLAPVYNWGGIYVGINGGWGFGSAKWNVPLAIGAVSNVGGISSSIDDNGGVVGGTLGFNYQANAFVFGVEGDWDYSGINTGTSSSICNNFGTCQTGNNWLATLRGRVGYAADRVLFFGTAGGVFGNAQTTLNGLETDHTQTGWTAGLGVEFAFADNWTAKVEYLYVDLGSTSVSQICSTAACTAANGGAPLPLTASASLTENLVRVGVNYKFNY
jgi:outer membrane immunogenic protein